MKIRNLTPHALCLFDDGVVPCVVMTLDPTGFVARVLEDTLFTGNVEVSQGVKFPMEEVKSCGVSLPEEAEGVLFIVSSMVRDTCSWRRDLVSPGKLVRDGEGNVVGCRSLVKRA